MTGVLGDGVVRPLASRSLPFAASLMTTGDWPPRSSVTSSDFFRRVAQTRFSLLPPLDVLSFDDARVGGGAGRERVCPMSGVNDEGTRGAEDLESGKKLFLEVVTEGNEGCG